MSRSPGSACSEVRDQLALAAGQDLPDGAARRVWAHLAGCMACRREYSVFLEHRAALAELEPSRSAPPLGPAFFRELQQDVMARTAEPARARPRWGLRAAVAAAALLVLGVATFSPWRSDGLLHREPFSAQPARPDPGQIPLSYPQGLLGRQQVDLLFSRDGDPVWPARLEGAPARDPLLRRVSLPDLDDR